VWYLCIDGAAAFIACEGEPGGVHPGIEHCDLCFLVWFGRQSAATTALRASGLLLILLQSSHYCACFTLCRPAHVVWPGLVLSSKIAPRAFGGVNSPDALCARHALAVAALAARDMPGMYIEQMGQLVANSLEIWRTTGAGMHLHSATPWQTSLVPSLAAVFAPRAGGVRVCCP